MNDLQIIDLNVADVERILDVERRAFIPPLQASRQTVLTRFDLGHWMLGLETCGQLVGTIVASYARFDPSDRAKFVSSEREFGLQPKAHDCNAMFICSLGVAPSQRGGVLARALCNTAINRAKRDGCAYWVAPARIPSYNGSPPGCAERIEANPTLRAAIDRCLAGGPLPTVDELRLDPLVRFYYSIGSQGASRFLWVEPNFTPGDKASGGIRVIYYGDLATWPEPAAFPTTYPRAGAD